MTDADPSRNGDAQPMTARPRKSNVRTALVLACVAVAFYFGMIFIGPLSR